MVHIPVLTVECKDDPVTCGPNGVDPKYCSDTYFGGVFLESCPVACSVCSKLHYINIAQL